MGAITGALAHACPVLACEAGHCFTAEGVQGCFGLVLHVISVGSLAAAVASLPPLVSPAPHMAGQVAGGKSLPLLIMWVADAVWQESRLVCSLIAGQASPNPSLSHRKVALIYLFCIWLFFQHWSANAIALLVCFYPFAISRCVQTWGCFQSLKSNPSNAAGSWELLCIYTEVSYI